MKKLLLTGAMLMALSFTSNAQDVLYSENFDALTVGDVGTDIGAETPGQGGLYTSTVNGFSEDFQIVANGEEGNGLQLSAGDGAGGTNQDFRFIWADGLGDAWAERTEGNDFVTAEYTFYSGVVDGSATLHQAALYNEDYLTLGGFEYDSATGQLDGLVHYSTGTEASTGTYNITLATGGLVIPENTWVHLGVAINLETGRVIWASEDILVPGTGVNAGQMVPFVGAFTSTYIIGLEPFEFDFAALPLEENTAVSTAIYDNVAVRATTQNLEDFLSTKAVATTANTISVYPNPANDVVNVKGTAQIESISIVDLNGRTVKSGKFTAATEVNVNVSNLSAGVYMMIIASDKGTVTKKIVKN